MDIDTILMQTLKMVLFQGLVVGIVTETIEQASHFHALFPFLPENVEEQVCDGVVSKVKVLHVDATLCLSDLLKHVCEFLLARHQQFHTVLMGKRDTILADFLNEDRIAGLCPYGVK
jgi:hypothetical protein